MPRLLIDATPVKPDAKGVGRYAYNACLQLAQRLPQDWTIHVLVHSEACALFPLDFRGKLVPVPHTSEILHGVFALPNYTKKLRSDILLKTMESSGSVRVPTVSICHDIDILILQAQGRYDSVLRRCINTVKRSLRQRALKNSKYVICNSNFTHGAVQRHYKIAQSRAAIAYCGVDPRFYEISSTVDKEEIRRRYGLLNFIVAFATGDPRENFKLLPAILQKLKELGTQVCFLIAGIRPAMPYATALRSHFQELGLVEGKDFIFKSFLAVDRFADLAEVYTAADFYLELSLHEGFGMQLAEAMACGTTCISSPNGALTEISDRHTIFIDPTNAEDVAEIIAHAYKAGLHLRDNQPQVSYTRKFSWDAMGEVVTRVLLKLADEGSVMQDGNS
jgi:glycosyltransferase involved in cell wall biosynthesis